MRSTVWVVLMILCTLGLVARAEVAVTTADGMGADTYLTNDDQESATSTHGTDIRIRAFRQLLGTRSKTGYIRFDLNGVDGDPNSAFMTFALTYQKGGVKTVNVYGLKDGAADFWNEATTSYSNAAGVLSTTAGNILLDESMTELLGTMSTPGTPEPNQFSTTPLALPLEDFLKRDTNGLVTFLFVGTGENENEIASKERADALIPPTLTLPNGYPVKRASNPSPANLVKVMVGEYSELSWTLPEPNLPSGEISCDVYFSDSEPNTLLPNWGMTLLQAGVEGSSVAMPTLDVYKNYYWRVDVYDTSRDPVLVKGKVWSFNTNNAAPTVNAGADQYVWVAGGAVVDTTSSNDTYLRDSGVYGSEVYVDVRGGSIDRVGYIQFDLSALSAMDPQEVKNATLTLRKVAGSRNDGINNGRFALHGLNNVSGNTPQNWSEATLTRSGDVTPGAEWNEVVPMDAAIASGRVTDLDDNVEGISEVIANDWITITGTALDAFLQSRIADGGLVTFIVACEDGNDRGYGIASKENSDPSYRPRLQLNYGDAGVEVTLSGSYDDDGLPVGTETVLWTETSRPEGAEPVIISPANVLETTVNLVTPGFYEFQLAANDTELEGTDTVQIYVGYNPCDAAQKMPTYKAHAADFNGDCFVTLADFVTFAEGWLNCTSLVCP